MHTVRADAQTSNGTQLLSNNRHLLLFLAALFLLSWAALTYLNYQVEQNSALEFAEQQVQSQLHVHRALHTYVEDIQKPEIYRLKDTGKLYQEYFSPKLLSFTFIARNLQQNLQQERTEQGLPRIHFKLASNNPRNPINQANKFEQDLLRRMNHEGLEEYRSVLDYMGGEYFYMALPVTPNRRSCMRCHGDPETAPRELIERYGDKRGFREEPGSIRAMISIRVPLDAMQQENKYNSMQFGAASFSLFLLVFIILKYFIVRLDREQQKVFAQNLTLEELSNTDELTQLNNRRKFNSDLENEIELARRYRTSFSIVLLDIDFFKRVNDTHGHLLGDEILVQFSRLMQQEIRVADRCARWGGEEFIILLPNTSISGAINLADKLQDIFKNHSFPSGIQLTASFGIAEYKHGEDIKQLLSRLDKALYDAKKQGRDCIVIASSDQQDGIQ
jgi:two-component system, cell cycle response regulator